MKTVILMLASVLLFGCASMRWSHPESYDNAILESDIADCEKQAKALDSFTSTEKLVLPNLSYIIKMERMQNGLN